MTKEDVKDRLINNYNHLYNDYMEAQMYRFPLRSKMPEPNKKRYNKIEEDNYMPIWTFENEGNKNVLIMEPACYVVELALEGLPEATFEAIRHKTYLDKYKERAPKKEVIELINGRYSIRLFKKRIMELMVEYYKKAFWGEEKKENAQFKKKLEEEANRVARQDWERERCSLFMGPSGEYENESTWEWIETEILPFATRDIWESLDYFYGDDAFVSEADKTKFRLYYKEYCRSNGIAYKRNIEPDEGVSLIASSKYEIIKEIKDVNDYIERLSHATEPIKVDDLIYGYCLEEKSYLLTEKNTYVLEIVSELFEQADEIVCRKFIREIKLISADISSKWQILRRIFARKRAISKAWRTVISEMFKDSKSGIEDNFRLWIQFIYECDKQFFKELIGENIEFWEEIPSQSLINMMLLVKECVPNESQDNVEFEIYKYIYHMAKENNRYERIWDIFQKKWIISALNSDESIVCLSQLQRYSEAFCENNEDYDKLLRNMSNCMYQLMTQSNYRLNSHGFSKENLLKSSKVVSNSIEKLIRNIDEKKNCEESSAQILADISNEVKDLHSKWTYFIETWSTT